jgi:hypothetical protein
VLSFDDFLIAHVARFDIGIIVAIADNGSFAQWIIFKISDYGAFFLSFIIPSTSANYDFLPVIGGHYRHVTTFSRSKPVFEESGAG